MTSARVLVRSCPVSAAGFPLQNELSRRSFRSILLFFGNQEDCCVTDLIKIRLIIIIRLDGLDQNSKTDLAGIIVHEQFDFEQL